jgi:hypothetical protein
VATCKRVSHFPAMRATVDVTGESGFRSRFFLTEGGDPRLSFGGGKGASSTLVEEVGDDVRGWQRSGHLHETQHLTGGDRRWSVPKLLGALGSVRFQEIPDPCRET